MPVGDPATDEATEADTVMRVLERNAEISTRYGGGFVQSIDGLEAEASADGPLDWFFYVNGVESTVGAADYPLHGGEAIWWDYRDWAAAMRVPPWSAPGRSPSPAATTAGGDRSRSNASAEESVRRWSAQRLEDAGVAIAGGSPDGAIRVLVGPWARVRGRPRRGADREGPQAAASSPVSTRAAGSTPSTKPAGRQAGSGPMPGSSRRPGATKRRRPGS